MTNNFSPQNRSRRGFTLMELAIVVTIVGLIIAGLFVGQGMVSNAKIRSTITQVENFSSAANTFRLKYGALPGDIRKDNATPAGLFAITTSPATGKGDQNGLLQGFNTGVVCAMPCNDYFVHGENVVFWRHLSQAGMIKGQYGNSIVTATGAPAAGAVVVPAVMNLLPVAKIGSNAFFRVVNRHDNVNYFFLYAVHSIATTGAVTTDLDEGLTPVEAFTIDSKMDDGKPLSGLVEAGGTTAPYHKWLDASIADPPATGDCLAGDATNAQYATEPRTVGDTRACGLHFPFSED